MGTKIMRGLLDSLQGVENYNQRVLRELKQRHQRVVLYGAGYCGQETEKLLRMRGIPVAGVCDDMRSGEMMNGHKIYALSDIKLDADTVIFLTSGFNRKMKQNLVDCGLKGAYVPVDFGRYEPEKETFAYFCQHEQELEEAYDLFSDDMSRTIFRQLITYRITRKPGMMEPFEETGQYFPQEKELDLRSYNDCFLDLGAYDGDSICGFVDYVGDYRKIIAVEASKKNYRMLLEKTKALHDVECHCVGIWHERGQLRFTVSDAKNSFASSDGGSVLEVDSVDDILNGRPISFIKMDVEGAEYDALLGAEQTISDSHPAMAVSIYHNVDDLYRLPLVIARLSSRGGTLSLLSATLFTDHHRNGAVCRSLLTKKMFAKVA